MEEKSRTPAGVTAVYVYDGRVIAHASDFARPVGYDVIEAQTYRAKKRLAFEVVKALASPALYENLDAYECERIIAKMKGKVQVFEVGYSPEGQ